MHLQFQRQQPCGIRACGDPDRVRRRQLLHWPPAVPEGLGVPESLLISPGC